MKRFDIIEHTADVGIVAYGATLEEAFANAAYAMFTLIADLEEVREEVCRRIEVQAEDQESLLASWLNELLYLFDTEGVIFKTFEVTVLGEHSLKAEGRGEPLDPERHSLKAGVKAATYYMLRVMKDDDGYNVRVIFDV
ncbi:archease [Chloroflexota bacterium]